MVKKVEKGWGHEIWMVNNINIVVKFYTLILKQNLACIII